MLRPRTFMAMTLVSLLLATPALAQQEGGTDLLGWLTTLRRSASTATVPLSPAGTRPRGITPAAQNASFRAQEVLVTVIGDASTEAAIASDFGLVSLSSTPVRLLGVRIVRFRVAGTRSVDSVLQALAGDARIESAQPNFVYRPTASAASLPQFAIDKIGAATAQRFSRGRGVRIAVIDTGIDVQHPDLKGIVAAHFDAVGDGGSEPGTHGTAIAGLIAAQGTGSGLLGVAPDARLLSARAFAARDGADIDSDTLILLRALDWSAAVKAPIINLSLTGPNDPMIAAAVAGLVSDGRIVVAAAGNDGPDAGPAYPAALPGVLAVTATDSEDRLFDKANRGDYIAVAAPGVDVVTARPNGALGAESGTSMAAALASGTVALMVSAMPGVSSATVRDALTKSARDLGAPGHDATFGAGRIDAAAALATLTGTPLPVAVSAPAP